MSSKIVLAKNSKVGEKYLSRGGREVEVQQINDNHVKLRVLATTNLCPVPLDYPLTHLKDVTVNDEDIEDNIVENEVTKDVEDTLNDDTADVESIVNTGSKKKIKSEEESEEELSKNKKSFERVDPEDLDLTTGTIKSNILDLLRTGNGYSVKELADLTNGAQTTIRLKLSELRTKDGLLITKKNKKYFIEEDV